jgi:hypothetical protein
VQCEEYVDCDDDKLTPGAISLKNRLTERLNLIRDKERERCAKGIEALIDGLLNRSPDRMRNVISHTAHAHAYRQCLDIVNAGTIRNPKEATE